MKTIEQTAPNIFAPVEKITKPFGRAQQPDPKAIQPADSLRAPPEQAVISAEQLQLMAYFQEKLDALPEGRRMQDDDMFIAGLTVAEYFALPDSEQARLWEEEHLEVERELGYEEIEVQPDALPAGVRSLPP